MQYLELYLDLKVMKIIKDNLKKKYLIMIKIFLRQISINLSFFFEKKVKFNKKNHLLTEKYIEQKTKDLYLKNPRLSVHKKLSFEILNLIKKKKLKIFLRNSFIQNIFFIHNEYLFILGKE